MKKDEGKVDSAGLEPATFGVGTPMLSQLSQEPSQESMSLVVPYESTLPSGGSERSL